MSGLALTVALEKCRAENVRLKAKLKAYEKQWIDMNYTICKFQEENAQLKAKLP